MICNQASTTFTVRLPRRNCMGVPGWEKFCQNNYKDDNATYPITEINGKTPQMSWLKVTLLEKKMCVKVKKSRAMNG